MDRPGFCRTLTLLGLLAVAPGCAGSSASRAPSDSGSVTPAASFQLAWEDQFDSFDASRWQLMTHTWDGNLAQFSTENTAFAGGIASLRLTPAAADPAKPFRGVEMRSRDTITYGKIESRVRFARGSGVISSLVLIYTPWPASDWNELDVEFLGRYTDRAQTNVLVYTGPPQTAPVAQSVTPTNDEQLMTLSFDPTADFHVYTMEWDPQRGPLSGRRRAEAHLEHPHRSAQAAAEHPAHQFPNLLSAIYPTLAAKGKPIMIPETASAELGGDKGAWIAAILPALRSSYPAIKALVWFHMNKETDWRVDSSVAARDAFVALARDPFFNP